MAKERKTTENTSFNNQQQSQQAEQAARAGMFDTTNELGFSQAPTENWKAYNDLAGFSPQADPSIASRFGAARNRIISGYFNPGGAYSTPELNMQRQMSALGALGQQEGAERAADNAQNNQQRLQQLTTLVGASAPVSYNRRTSGTTGEASSGSGTSSGTSSGTGNSVKIEPGQSLFGSLLGGLGAGFGGALGGKIPF